MLVIKPNPVLLTLFLRLLLWTSTTVVDGAVSCGDVVSTLIPGSDGVVRLTNDLECPCGFGDPPPLTLEGPAKLNLGGHTVSCIGDSDPYNGIIAINGTGAILKNGVLKAAANPLEGGSAVSVKRNSGQHVIRNVTTEGTGYGFFLWDGSNGNKIVSCHINHANQNAIYVRLSTDNTIKGSVLDCAETGTHGIYLEGGHGHTITSNEVKNCREGGINIYGGSDNVVKANKVHDCGQYGIRAPFQVSKQNRIINNHVVDNGGDGISLAGESHRIVNNTISGNGGAGIMVDGDLGRIVNNMISGNSGDGILVAGDSNRIVSNNISGNLVGIVLGGFISESATTSSNHIARNTVTSNQFDGIRAEPETPRNTFRLNNSTNNGNFDVRDQNSVNCAENTWQHNNFGSASPNCIE